MFCRIALLIGGIAALSATSLDAQEAILGQKYGQGVHEYFAGDYSGAYSQLTAAIKGGSKDPRVFYFRGLTFLKLGRAPDAATDFAKGASYESRDLNKFYNVSKAIERIQGPARREIENHRTEARMLAMEQAERLRKARYEAIQREEKRVLREQAAVAEPIATPAVEPKDGGETDPFATSEEDKEAPAKKSEAKAEKKAEKEPAAEEEATKAEEPATEADPFAAPAEKAEESKEKPTKEKPADKSDSDDPFAS
jgi:hypothetical protein